jgi:hypothetical protein
VGWGLNPEQLVLETSNLPIDLPTCTGAGERIRTVDINLGKVALYQLSYARKMTGPTDFGVSAFDACRGTA